MKTWGIASSPDSAASGSAAAGVVVLGSGRSGTSAVTRAFALAGFFVGREDEVLGASPSNAHGHYEPLAVLRINEEVLAEQGCHWWADPPDPAAQRAERKRLEPRLASLLEEMVEAADGRPIALKEPRINSLLPLWGPVIEGALHPVLAVRDPFEAAMSLARRDGTSLGHALAAWEIQTALALDWLHGRTATVAPYAELVARPPLAAELVVAASSHLEASRLERLNPGAAPAALDPSLRHEDEPEGARDEELTGRQAALWRFLASLPPGDVELRVPEPLRAPGPAALAMAGEESQRIALAAELERARGRSAELERELARRREELASAEARQAEELGRIVDSLSWRLTSPLRRLRRPRGSARGDASPRAGS